MCINKSAVKRGQSLFYGRKTEQNGISAGLGLPKEPVAEALENIVLQKDIRAEKMTMQELAALADSLCV